MNQQTAQDQTPENEFDTLLDPSRPQFDIITSQEQVNLFLSGQGGGKTFCAGAITGKLISDFPEVHGFIGANTYTQLTDSTLSRIRTVWAHDFGWTEWSRTNPYGHYVVDIAPPGHFNTEGHQYDSYHGKITFEWGTVIYKGSLDNYKAHDGKEFAWAILDETKDTRVEAVKEVILGRLREHGMQNDRGEPWNPLYIFTSPAKVKWLNDWFDLQMFEPEIKRLIYSSETYFSKRIDNKFVVICSTYHNEKNLPSNYIVNHKKNLNSELQDMLIYGNPFARSGGEFYKPFDRNIHVKPCKHKYRKDQPLLHTFDFNVIPYMTSLQIVMEHVDSIWWIYFIGETCTPSPNNRTRGNCKVVVDNYRGHSGGGFYTGDWNGKSRNTGLAEEYEHQYDIVQEVMYAMLSRDADRTIPNMPVSKRRDFVLDILEEKLPIRIVIDPSCVELIDDMVYLKQAPDGSKLKEKELDKITDKYFEKRGHTSDAMEYFLSSVFEDSIK